MLQDPDSLNPPAGGLVPPETVVAIDGPAGVGKSTTARALAERLGLLYVDSGAMYRALTWAALRAGTPVDDGPALAELLDGADLDLDLRQRESVVLWNRTDISREIRSPEIEANVSSVAAESEVRARMVALQRGFGRRRGVVMEGRDIGTAVFPLADAKIFLDASLEARTRRRLRQHQRQGVEIEEAALRADIAERDRLDSERDTNPLTIPPDAIVIDNSDIGLQEQLDITTEAVLQIIEQKQPVTPPPGSPSAVLPVSHALAYRVMGPLGKMMGLRIIGRRWADMVEGKIIAPNHVSNWDPPMLAAALSDLGHTHSVAKEELFKPPLQGAFFRFLFAVPIRRSIYDKDAFGAVEHFLSLKHNVVFFPEGMRRVFGEPGPVRNGLGMLMQRTGAPAVPLFFRGTLSPEFGGSSRAPLEARFAPPVRLHALPTLRERMNEREINAAVARLFEAIYRELQDRSFADHPMSDWEREFAEGQREKVRRKEARTFKRRAARRSP